MNTSSAAHGVTVILPAGRLDAAGARPLQVELQRQFALGRSRLVLDLSQTSYISSNGLRVLLSARREAEKMGGACKLCGLGPRLLEIFEMAGFDQVFQLFPTCEQAVNSFA